jgi:hypothetical protein
MSPRIMGVKPFYMQIYEMHRTKIALIFPISFVSSTIVTDIFFQGGFEWHDK